MKTDDFEQQLKRQPFRQVPERWREEILDKATAAQPVSRSERWSGWKWWRELLWPCPQAWAALGAAWIIMVGLNAHLSDNHVAPMVKRGPRQISQEMLMALQQQWHLRMELSGTGEPTTPAEPAQPRPRTQREFERAHA